MKECKRCKEPKEITDFYEDRLICKECVGKHQKIFRTNKKAGIKPEAEKLYRPPRGLEKHHWNLNPQYLNDFIIMDGYFRDKLLKYLVFNLKTRLYSTLHGTVLCTKEKHSKYINRITELISEFK